MKNTRLPHVMWLKLKKVPGLSGIICLLTLATVASAQSLTATTDTDAMRRITRARALAAIGSFQAALTELEPMRQANTDASMQDVVRILVMNIYLQQTDYTRAQKLLDEIFDARKGKDEHTTRAYFALAGQVINGVRAHVERYRTFGLNTGDAELPAEARNDLDRVRLLLERLIEQARQIYEEDVERTDTMALLEDAAKVRLALARDGGERKEWQREVVTARHKLGTSETSVANYSSVTPPRRTAVNPAPRGGSQTPGDATSGGPTLSDTCFKISDHQLNRDAKLTTKNFFPHCTRPAEQFSAKSPDGEQHGGHSQATSRCWRAGRPCNRACPARLSSNCKERAGRRDGHCLSRG